jgi:hypothetical protein
LILSLFGALIIFSKSIIINLQKAKVWSFLDLGLGFLGLVFGGLLSFWIGASRFRDLLMLGRSYKFSPSLCLGFSANPALSLC